MRFGHDEPIRLIWRHCERPSSEPLSLQTPFVAVTSSQKGLHAAVAASTVHAEKLTTLRMDLIVK